MIKLLFQNLLFQSPFINLFSLTTILIYLHYGNAMNLPNNETVPALFVFGDSVVDSGNNNYINTIIKCDFPPYGEDFCGGNQPTGRFTNGLVPSDIIASKFGVKKLLPASLDPNLQLQDLLTGVSFASGGAGYEPLTSQLAVNN
ncbi:GDSL esterase/lipase EXL3 [Trifolium repens]|nr:GDSL esterase/lipase EXL3 [Trifolium repens]